MEKKEKTPYQEYRQEYQVFHFRTPVETNLQFVSLLRDFLRVNKLFDSGASWRFAPAKHHG